MMFLIFKLTILFYLLHVISSIQTTKGGDMVVFDGYEYRKKGTSVTGEVQFWQCLENLISNIGKRNSN